MTHWQSPATLDERVAALERRARRMKWIGVMQGAIVGAAVAMALVGGRAVGAQARGAQQERVVARAFVIVDAEGKPRGGFGVGEDGVQFGLQDKAGRPRLLLGVRDDGAAQIALLGTTSAAFPRVTLSQGANGFQTFSMEDAAGEKASFVAFSHQPNDQVQIELVHGDRSIGMGVVDPYYLGARLTDPAGLTPAVVIKEKGKIVARLQAPGPGPR